MSPLRENVLRLDDYRPHVTIPAEDAVHVVPLAYFRAWLRGDDVEPIPAGVLRTIVSDWLIFLEEQRS